jgi:acetoin utilization deacetylase AcuC-like enzyme
VITVSTGRVFGDVFLYEGPPWHFDKPRRLEVIRDQLQACGLWGDLIALPVPQADTQLIGTVHEAAYIEDVRATSEMGGDEFDLDTVVTEGTYEAAASAVGGCCAAVDAMLSDDVRNAVCLVRPPGHQALPDRALGSCIFNTLAIAAEHAIRAHDLQRVAIVDFDARHGSGLQQHFIARRDVLYISLHQYPLSPGTGAVDETGVGPGLGYTVNLPLPPGTSDRHIELCFSEIVLPVLLNLYEPELLLVAAGYGGYHADETADLELSVQSFYVMTRLLTEVAGAICAGRICLALEGGYDLDALGYCVANSVAALRGRPAPYQDNHQDNGHTPHLDRQVAEMLEFHKARMAQV